MVPDEIFLEIFAFCLCHYKYDSLWRMEEWPVKRDLPGGFLGGSAPRLQRLILRRVPFPTLPTLLLSARDLVHLRYDLIPPTGYISPEAMVAGLAVLTRLETLVIQFYPLVYLPEQRRRCPEPSMRAVLPALTDFEFGGFGEYSEDFMAQIDAPRFHRVTMILHRFDCLRELQAESNAIAYLTLVLSRMSAVCSHVQYQYLAIYDCENRPGSSWHDYIDRTEWLAFFRQLTTVEMLYIYGGLAAQAVRALEDVLGEMVTEVLPSLHSLWVHTSYLEPVNLKPAEQFLALRRLYGRPVTICHRHFWGESFEGV
ncbi:hypothetical protein EDB83DRAFT_2553832 [Lactarius deliciosus]|nr:hypothetical protein EDB83DRAFT_2553832 [Lactarius deliciosus]